MGCCSPPKRLKIAVMLFMMCFMSYTMRVNLSINIIAMTSYNPDDKELEDYGPRYYFNQNDQGKLLGAYFYGYLLTCLPGGILAERFGGTLVAGSAAGVGAVLTAFTPLVAAMGMWPLFILRFLIGFFGGVTYPCCHNLVSKWAPPTEKGKFIASLMGGTFGTVVTWPICGIIIKEMGWVWAFYLGAIFCGVVTAVWFWIVRDTPAEYSTISPHELEYIQNSLGNTISNKKKSPPFGKVLTSIPFWALLLLHYGSMWGLFFLITATPKFMNEVLDFDLKAAGFVSSLPHLARLVCAFGFGALCDYIRRKQWITITCIRKLFCVPSHVIPGSLLLAITFFEPNANACVAIMTFSLGFNGAATCTNLANSQDLAPNFAGTLYGAINFVGTTPGFFSPMIVAYFTQDNNTMEEWKSIFLIGGSAYIIPAVVFWICGSGEVQPWNYFD